MNNRTPLAAICCLAGAWMLAGCTSNDKPKPAPTAAQPRAERGVTTREGVAGGLTEDVVVIEAIVTDVDTQGHRVTLTGPEGRQYSFDVNPKIKDISKLKPNDKVTATFSRRVWVTVKREDEPASSTYERTWGASSPGEMPGRLSAQETTKVGRVTAIDTIARTADVEFTDDLIKRIPVRSDVDLSKYKVGDNVVIRVTTALTVLSQKA